MKNQLDTFANSLQFNMENIKEKSIKNETEISKLSGEIEDLKNQLAEQKKINQQMKQKCKQLAENTTNIDCYMRRENLIFNGITQHAQENCEQKLKYFMKTTLQLDADTVNNMKFQRCHRLRDKSTQPAPIICRFVFYADRISVESAIYP